MTERGAGEGSGGPSAERGGAGDGPAGPDGTDDRPARVAVAWSGGKDAAMALDRLRRDDVAVVELLTTVGEETARSSMHGVRRSLHERQAAALDVPLSVVALPPEPSNDEYAAAMASVLAGYRERGVGTVVFGDVFLEDVRAYREDQLEGTGVAGCWPLWGRDTADLVDEFLGAGFAATVVAVDGAALDASFAGRPFDEAFVDDLPPGVDPAGENGEFHTFVRDGPPFESPVRVERGETVTRPVGDGEYHYCDLRPDGGAA